MSKELIQGNEAMARGALRAGMSFFASYPITPATEILHYLSALPDFNVVQAEDEIASINMVIGASLGGAKAMTASSGPGMSLKQEGIGLAHMAEIPLVVVNVMRVGPSTGMPTLPAQGDIMQVTYGSHGDYFPLAFYPNSIQECYEQTIHAFNAAEESLSPVTLLSDAFLSHLYEPLQEARVNIGLKKRKRAPFGQGQRHITGLLAEQGLPRTKDSAYYEKFMRGLKQKIDHVADRYAFYEYQPHPRSKTLLISYGITSRVVLPLSEKYSYFRPIRMFPVLASVLEKISPRYKNIIVIEMNMGQYTRLIQRVLQRPVHCVEVLGGALSLNKIQEKIATIIK